MTLNDFKSLIAAPLLYLGIKTEVVMVLFILMTMDMLVGTIKSYVLNIDISMKRFCFGFISKLLILFFPLTIALMGKGLERDFKVFVDLTMWVLIVNDGLSILRNLISIRTRRELKSHDLVTRVLHLISGKMLQIYEWIVDQIDKKKEG